MVHTWSFPTSVLLPRVISTCIAYYRCIIQPQMQLTFQRSCGIGSVLDIPSSWSGLSLTSRYTVTVTTRRPHRKTSPLCCYWVSHNVQTRDYTWKDNDVHIANCFDRYRVLLVHSIPRSKIINLTNRMQGPKVHGQVFTGTRHIYLKLQSNSNV